MPFRLIRIGRMICSVRSCQCANIKLLSNFSAYSGPYCFRPYIIPLAICVDRSVIFDRYCMIRLLQSNVISICLALGRLNKFSNISCQFSKIAPFGFRFYLFPRDGDIMPNVEIESRTGENVDWHWVGGASLSFKKYRPLAKAASDSLFQYV